MAALIFVQVDGQCGERAPPNRRTVLECCNLQAGNDRIRDADIRKHQFPTHRSPRKQKMAGLLAGKSDSNCCAECAAQNPPALAGNARRQVYSHNRKTRRRYTFDRSGSVSGNRFCKACSIECIDHNGTRIGGEFG